MELILEPGFVSQRWDAFWDHVDASGDCWEWTGTLMANKYAYFSEKRKDTKRKTWLSHRIAYLSLVGPINGVIDHLCRVPHCVNPDHMEVVSRGENVLRGMGRSAQNARKSHCVWGHPFDAENTHYRKEGHRECRACMRRRYRDYRNRSVT